jgi:type II restriction/modification system DNA methylase subunit YeeA
MQKYGCQFYFVNEDILKRQYSLGFPKNSSRTQFIGRYILKYHEQGFIASLQRKWFSGSCRNYIYDGSDEKYTIPDFHSLDTASFSGALILLGIGLLIGVAVTVVECIVFKWAESVSKKGNTIFRVYHTDRRQRH